MDRGLTRRGFLRGAGGVLALSVLELRAGPGRAAEGAPAAPAPAYRGFQDLYRERWTWDRVVKGTHFVNCWYQRGCNWNVYVKDGLVWREEQAATYEPTNAEVPDFNPRGCQKGACYSERMYDASRLRHPLVRVGERGAGRWKRISWEEALAKIGDAAVDVLATDGPAAIVWDQGTNISNGCVGLGVNRAAHVLDTLVLDQNAEIGDDHPGAAVTCGTMTFSSSADDLFYSDLILIWGGNPIYTQIPQAHFLTEARYHGARVVTIAPDYSASAVHADQWIPVEIGSDAALALSLAQVIVEEGLHDEAFVAEQTDLPLLVRGDTRRFLRGSDLEEGGGDDGFYVFDRASRRIREVSKRSLALGGVDPALEGEFRVATRDGEVAVTPVFALLRQRLAEYAPERAAATTGVRPEVARELARRIARAKAATIITQSNLSKFYHSLEMERAQILVMALSGQIGRKGSGINCFPYLSLAGPGGLVMASGSMSPRLALAAQALKAAPTLLRMKLDGYTGQMMIFEMARREYARGQAPPTNLYLYRHGGLETLYGRSREWDPWMKRELGEYVDEAVAKGWQFVPETPPRILFESGGNLLRRIRGYPRMIEAMLPRLDLLVTIDVRMSNTARHSDLVLPAAGWYEKDDITWATPISPYAHVTTRATEPFAESKSDWQIHCLIVKAMQERAVARNVRTFRDRSGKERRLDRVYDELTFGRRYTEDNTEEFLEEILSITSNLGGIGWEELKEKGFARYTELGMDYMNIGNATDIVPGETITANTWHTEKKQPWPTLTRRMQFYIDHDWYLELGEELPIHRDNPAIGGNHPLQLTGGHTRWSIHATWRDQKHMLQLHRGEPVVFLAVEDARARGIRDGDRVRAYNDIDSFELQAKISPAVRPGQAMVYHAWEPYQFPKGRSYAALQANPINPIQLAGGYFHLQPTHGVNTPGSADRGTRIEIERLGRRA